MTEKPKRKRWKWIAYPLGVVVGIYALGTALVNLNALQKPASFPHSVAASAASLGVDRIKFTRDAKWVPSPELEAPTCRSDSKFYDGENLSLLQCVYVSQNDYVGCGIWYDYYCVSLQAHAFLLSQPDRMGRVVEALIRPCKYLKDPKDFPWMKLPEVNRKMYKRIFEREWKRAMCNTHPDGYPGRVVLTFYGEEQSDEKAVFQIVKPEDDW